MAVWLVTDEVLTEGRAGQGGTLADEGLGGLRGWP